MRMQPRGRPRHNNLCDLLSRVPLDSGPCMIAIIGFGAA
jgi:hypothetical protein